MCLFPQDYWVRTSLSFTLNDPVVSFSTRKQGVWHVSLIGWERWWASSHRSLTSSPGICDSVMKRQMSLHQSLHDISHETSFIACIETASGSLRGAFSFVKRINGLCKFDRIIHCQEKWNYISKFVAPSASHFHWQPQRSMWEKHSERNTQISTDSCLLFSCNFLSESLSRNLSQNALLMLQSIFQDEFCVRLKLPSFRSSFVLKKTWHSWDEEDDVKEGWS